MFESEAELFFGLRLAVGQIQVSSGISDEPAAEFEAAIEDGLRVPLMGAGFVAPGTLRIEFEIAGPGVARVGPEFEALEGIREIEAGFGRGGQLLDGAGVEVEGEGIVEGTFEAIAAREVGVGEFKPQRRVVGGEVAGAFKGGDGVIPAAIEEIELRFEAESGGLFEIGGAEAGFGFEQGAGFVEGGGERAGLAKRRVFSAGPAGGERTGVAIGGPQEGLRAHASRVEIHAERNGRTRGGEGDPNAAVQQGSLRFSFVFEDIEFRGRCPLRKWLRLLNMSLTRRQALGSAAAAPLALNAQTGGSPAAGKTTRLAVSTYSYWHFKTKRVPVEFVIDDAARLGFEGVEILHRGMAEETPAH